MDRTPLKKVFTVLVMTVSSLANGGIMGGLFGFVSGGWTTRTVAGAWTNAKTNALSLGGLSAAYTGLQTLAKVSNAASSCLFALERSFNQRFGFVSIERVCHRLFG